MLVVEERARKIKGVKKRKDERKYIFGFWRSKFIIGECFIFSNLLKLGFMTILNIKRANRDNNSVIPYFKN